MTVRYEESKRTLGTKRVATYRWLPATPPVAALHISHGMSEHARRYARFARFLAERGIAVFAHDHRGHGHSVESHSELGQMGGADAWGATLSDLYSLVEDEKSQFDGIPFVLFGHSMGSFFAQDFAITHARAAKLLDALILSGTSGPPPAIAQVGRLVSRFERFRRGESAASPLLEKLSFGSFNERFPGRTPFDWLSRDEVQVDAYVNDDYCGVPISTSSWVSLLDRLPTLFSLDALQRMPKQLPVLLISGENDPVGEFGKGPKKLLERLTAAGVGDVTLKLYPGARHEVLNEVNAAEVMEDVYTWVSQRLGLAAGSEA